MPTCRNSRRINALLASLLLLPCGCGGSTEQAEKEPAKPAGKPADPGKEYQAIDLNLGVGGDDAKPKAPETFTAEDVRRELNPLQVMVGGWTGTLRNAAAEDAFQWAWDYTDRKQPALAFDAMKNVVMQSGRLTYQPADEAFVFVVVDAEGRERTLEGTFIEKPRKIAGDDDRLHMTYKLQVTEEEPPEGAKALQIVFNQQENNRFLLEIAEKVGSNFRRDETVALQRENTSFARSFDDYGERTCIVSQGLGTMTVTHEGKTFYVCCSGCKAAFEEDPEFWIAKAKEREAEKE